LECTVNALGVAVVEHGGRWLRSVTVGGADTLRLLVVLLGGKFAGAALKCLACSLRFAMRGAAVSLGIVPASNARKGGLALRASP
jgi:hypothetical protein